MTLLQVSLTESAAAEIRRLAVAAYPHEGCGVLVGRYAASSVSVVEATSGRNLWADRLGDRYDLDPAHIQTVDRGARARGLDVVGFWHSHPDHLAWPSQLDSDRAWTDSAYLIVSSRSGGTGDLNAFAVAREGEGLHPVALAGEGA